MQVIAKDFNLLNSGERPQRVLTWVVRFARRKPLGALGGVIVVLLLVVALLADILAPYHYADSNVRQRLNGPTGQYRFGTDEQGRDVFSRVIYGARTSVLIGFGAVGISVVLASLIGSVCGYFGGSIDMLFQRIIDIWLAFPGLIFVIFVVSIFGKGNGLLVLTLGLLISAGSSRIVRSAAIVVRAHQYVEAAKTLGASDLRVMVFHVLPNVAPVIIISASIQIGAVILLESSLAFLGFGTPPPFPSWGRMLQESQAQMQYHPYLTLFPGIAIAITVYSLNMLGDALRDVLDPRLRGSR